jgi:hypothetical protein
MRSRLEALVAAYLDRRGFVWQYEPVCFAGMRGQYLPNFRVQRSENADVYLEVKPKPKELATMAYQQIERMSVIWESEPHARLIIVSGLAIQTPISFRSQAILKPASLGGTWMIFMRPSRARGLMTLMRTR